MAEYTVAPLRFGPYWGKWVQKPPNVFGHSQFLEIFRPSGATVYKGTMVYIPFEIKFKFVVEVYTMDSLLHANLGV